jgi:hypothetical protein
LLDQAKQIAKGHFLVSSANDWEILDLLAHRSSSFGSPRWFLKASFSLLVSVVRSWTMKKKYATVFCVVVLGTPLKRQRKAKEEETDCLQLCSVYAYNECSFFFFWTLRSCEHRESPDKQTGNTNEKGEHGDMYTIKIARTNNSFHLCLIIYLGKKHSGIG